MGLKEGKSQRTEELHEMLSSVCARAVVHTDSQQLWSPTQDVHKIKPIENSSMDLGEAPRLPLVCKEYWQLMAFGEGRVTFL